MNCPCPSCALRASWTPARRAALDAADDAAFALEAAERAGVRAVALAAPDPAQGPALRLVRQVEDLTGRRLGRLRVLERVLVTKRGAHNAVRQAWRVRCDCGRVVVMMPETLRRGASRCHPCAVSDANRGSRRGIVARFARRTAA